MVRPYSMMAGLLALLIAGCGDGRTGSRNESGEEPPVHTRQGLPPILAMNAFYYYQDLEGASRFYTEVLGLPVVADYGFARMLRVSPSSYLTLVDETRGMHSSREPKSATLAVVTDQVEGWWEYLSAQGVQVRAPLGSGEGRPHDGFVVVDPEGYFLEFERFNPHPENERLRPILDSVRPLFPAPGEAAVRSPRPDSLGIQATVLWLYYSDLEAVLSFYREGLGLDLLVDQGWAKVLSGSPTGFLGLVDGERGLHNATPEKAVTVSFFTAALEPWLEKANAAQGFTLRPPGTSQEGDFVRTFVGLDPEGYFLEWDVFLDVPVNRELLRLLGASDATRPSGS